MQKVFLSSRWNDTFHATERIYQGLVAALGGDKERVFKELHHPRYGQLIGDKILAALEETEVLLAVIGPTWLEELRRRDAAHERDWVRFEIESASARSIPVIPVYVDDAPTPPSHMLPEGLRDAFDREGKVLPKHENFDVVLSAFVDQLVTMYPELLAEEIKAPRTSIDECKKRGRYALALVIGVWSLFFWYFELRTPAQADPEKLGEVLQQTSWVAYDPSEMTMVDEQPLYPPMESIVRDLDAIAAAGFTGVVTSGSNGVMADVPRLAHERGLRVIMGIWDPRHRTELTRAIRRRPYVTAYCVGHDRADPYLLAMMRGVVNHIKRRTGLPTTTTEMIVKYNDEFAQFGDWLFPDAHIPIRDRPAIDYAVDVERDVGQFRDQALAIATLAQNYRRPLLLKNVAYPHDGIQGASEEQQEAFFRQLLETLRDPISGLPVSAPIVVQGAFDSPWKLKSIDQRFHNWDAFTGVIELNEVDGKKSVVQFRPVTNLFRRGASPKPGHHDDD